MIHLPIPPCEFRLIFFTACPVCRPPSAAERLLRVQGNPRCTEYPSSIEVVTGFRKPCMNRLVRRLRRIPHLPVQHYTGEIRQNRKAQPLVFHELLCFCSDMLCVDRCCAGRFVRAEMKIYDSNSWRCSLKQKSKYKNGLPT